VVPHHAHLVEFLCLTPIQFTLERAPLLVPEQFDGFLLGRCTGQLGPSRLELLVHAGELEHSPLGVEVVLELCTRLEFHRSDIDPLPYAKDRRECSPLITHAVLTRSDTRFQCQTCAFEFGNDEHLVTLLAFTLVKHGLESEDKAGHGAGSLP
jgi:hypothetical protein